LFPLCALSIIVAYFVANNAKWLMRAVALVLEVLGVPGVPGALGGLWAVLGANKKIPPCQHAHTVIKRHSTPFRAPGTMALGRWENNG